VDLQYGAPRILRFLLDYFQICALVRFGHFVKASFLATVYVTYVSRKYDRFVMLMLTVASQETFVTRSGVIALPYID